VKNYANPETYLSQGGFPSSLLAKSELLSSEWRESFISTYIERDLLQWTGAQPIAVRRLWQMLAHVNGQTINFSSLANSLGLSHSTIRNYIDVLTATFMVDLVQPHVINTGKRIVKSPKVYLTDSGIISALLGLKNFNQLSGHPVLGSLWEGAVLSNLRGQFPDADIRFYRTNHGSEIDFLLVLPETLIAIECKAGLNPTLSRGSYTAIDDLKPLHTFIVAPVNKGYQQSKSIDVVNLDELTGRIAKMLV
jgi:predicted AAA+ superfamily ATPase